MDKVQESMGPLSTKYDNVTTSDALSPTEKRTSDGTDSVFYAIYIPDGPNKTDKSQPKVFNDKAEALSLVKLDKRARFKACSSLFEAFQFSIDGGGQQSAPAVTCTSTALTAERSAFSGPKSVDLCRLRKAIESGDLDFVKRTVWDNPRYLVSSGDTPSILHEGSRYNALHVCARTSNADVCAFVLQTISSVEFVRRLYGDTAGSSEPAQERCRVLVDLYLNTPDKGYNETPLHFASKHGAVDVVQVLVSYPQCDKHMLNKYQQSPHDVICTRVNGKSEDLSRRIRALLDEQYFVPVLRSSDPTIEASIGQPFSPSSPLNLSGDFMSPIKEIQGLAGPMPLDVAKTFRKNWKTPPRDPQSPLRKVIQDPLKGLENIGRKLAQDCNVQWKEYWPFLDMFADFHSHEGLSVLENFLADRITVASASAIKLINGDKNNKTPSSKSTSLSTSLNSNIDQSASPATESSICQSPLCKATNDVTNPTNDVTNGTNTATRNAVLSPMSELCCAMRSCRLSERNSTHVSRHMSPAAALISNITSPALQHSTNLVKNNNEPEVPLSLHLCIEKSCQVFAKRIKDNLLFCPESGCEMLASEASHMHTLITSFLADDRFRSINFSHLHNRIAKCIVQTLDPAELNELSKAVDMIRSKQLDESDSSSSEDEKLITPYRSSSSSVVPRRLFTSSKKRRKMHDDVLCITAQILLCLDEEAVASAGEAVNGDVINKKGRGLPTTEDACAVAWLGSASCQCSWSVPESKRLSWRNRSFLGNESPRSNKDCYCKQDEPKSAESIFSCAEENLLKVSSDEESDISDAEDNEFHTPPSSPSFQSLLVSDEENGMESPDEGPDIYLYSDGPTYLDNAVYQALDHDRLNPRTYPFIYRWSHFIALHSKEEREKWGQPKRSPNGGNPYLNSPSWSGTPEHYSPCRQTSQNFRSFKKVNNFPSKRLLF